MLKDNYKVLLTLPSLEGLGGVAGFYRGIFPHISRDNVVPIEIGGASKNGGLLYPLFDQIRFWHTVKRVTPDLIHLNPSLGFKSFIRDGLFAWQAKAMGYPLLVFWHGWDKGFESQVAEKYIRFFNATFGRADGFIVLASEFEKKLREWGVVAPVHLGVTNVEENLLSGVNIEKKWANFQTLPQINILFLARLESEKGAFETIRAIKLLADKNFSVRLTIAGDGSIRQDLENYVRSLNLTDHQVLFTGDIRGDEKVRVFNEHHIYCLPSYSEGLPISVLEAMAFGMPVVTCPVGGLVDVFQDGKMGAFVQCKDSKAIADFLEKMIMNQDKMVEIGKYNARYANEYFMGSVVAEKLLKIYQSILPDNFTL